MTKKLNWLWAGILIVLLCTSAVLAATSDEKSESLLIKRVQLLEEALAPRSPMEAVKRWAEGVKTRNGALQFAVLSPELREQEKSSFEKCGWVTGVSSPWVDRFEIMCEGETETGERKYRVKLYLTTSTGSAGHEEVHVFVREYGNKWFVTWLDSETDYYNLTTQSN